MAMTRTTAMTTMYLMAMVKEVRSTTSITTTAVVGKIIDTIGETTCGDTRDSEIEPRRDLASLYNPHHHL